MPFPFVTVIPVDAHGARSRIHHGFIPVSTRPSLSLLKKVKIDILKVQDESGTT
jgi:hypothetical protein